MTTNPANQTELGQQTPPARPIVPKSASEALRPEAGTPPPPASKRSRQSRNQFVVFLNFLMSAIVLVTLAALVLVYVGKRAFEEPGTRQTAMTFLVKPNTGMSEIADQLERRGLISDARMFQLARESLRQ